MEIHQSAEGVYAGVKKVRGIRKFRGSPTSRAGRLLLFVCGVLIIGGGILLWQVSPPLEIGDRLRTDFLRQEINPILPSGGKDDAVLEGDVVNVKIVSKVGFGSCTSRVAMEQPIWRHGVIPSDIEAWIWAGDIAYMDWPDVDCEEQPSHPNCGCDRNWLHSNPDSCLAGNMDHAKLKLEEQLQNLDYKKFVNFMCPSLKGHASKVLDLSLCERPVIGTWDDHDYNCVKQYQQSSIGGVHTEDFTQQDGDRRLPTKEEQKHLFLDALGVPLNSKRRTKNRGIYHRHTLNEGVAGKEIDVLLLDERFHRDTKPCHTRRDVCSLTKPYKTKYIWCEDFLRGGTNGKGSCCKKDDQIWQGWCRFPENEDNPLWDQVCNPKAPSYGFIDVSVDVSKNGSTGGALSDQGLSTEDSSPDAGVLCEVLGPVQRRWLQKELQNSRAPLKLVVSGSPLFSNPTNFAAASIKRWIHSNNCNRGSLIANCSSSTSWTGITYFYTAKMCSRARGKRPPVYCRCYDDFDCFQPAQQNLLHMIATAPGCVVVLTGDFHFSDIKVLQPGNHNYSAYYASTKLPRPIVQVMASGLTNDTALPAPCQGFRVDKVGLRPDGPCNFVSGPAFGFMEVDWDSSSPTATFQIRGDAGQVLLEKKVSLQTCLPLV